GAKPVKLYIWDDTAKEFIKWDGALNVSDIAVGAVEIKDHDGSDRAEVTSANALKTDPVSPTGVADGIKVVSSAGTDVVLASSTTCKRVIVQAQTDNTNLVAVGGAGVDATVATGTGVALWPGEAVDFEIDNLADIYIDSLVSGEGVRFFYFV
ncbi:hypothetical protein LCGC14_2990110, partial [marine sediment metagenome]